MGVEANAVLYYGNNVPQGTMMSKAAATASNEMKWPLVASEYEFLGHIGKGAFSDVCRYRCKAAGGDVLVAIKTLELENISSSFEDILQEIQTMRLSEDDNILRCYCSFVDGDKLWLVTQLMDKGSCQRVMQVSKRLGYGEGMNEEWLAYILREALKGLHYLHRNGQIHRDIKSGNILLDSEGSVRLADFGVSGWTVAKGQRHETVKTFVGTPCYMAPEVMEQLTGYDNRADIWSIGITALELAKGYAPYAHHSPMRVLILTIEEEPPSLASYPNDRQRTGAPFPPAFEDFYKKCLQKNPKNRPSAEELLRHKFLKNRSKDAIVNQLLNNISSVGLEDSPGNLFYPKRSTSSEIASAGPLPGGLAVAMPLDNADSSSSGLRNSSLSPSSQNTVFSAFNELTISMARPTVNANNMKLDGASDKRDNSRYVAGATWTFDMDGDEDGSRAPIARTLPSSDHSGTSEALPASGAQEFLSDFEADVLGSSREASTTAPSDPSTVANSMAPSSQTSPMYGKDSGSVEDPVVDSVSNPASSVTKNQRRDTLTEFLDEMEDVVDWKES